MYVENISSTSCFLPALERGAKAPTLPSRGDLLACRRRDEAGGEMSADAVGFG
jgi:hypothetical protein